jgi:uncharacterized protein YyaL (SSP411 family)
VLFSEIIHTPAEIVISGIDTLAVRQELHKHYLPFTVTVGSDTLSELSLLKGREPKRETQIYVCKNKTCQFPVTSVAEAIHQIETINN